MTKFPKISLISVLLLLAAAAGAHEGHGPVGSVGHDLQHQLWNFAGLIVLGAVLMAGDQIVALIRRSSRGKRPDGK